MTRPDGAGPLAGVRVIELSGIGPSRYAGQMLADLGAEVVLVERPGQVAKRSDTVVARGRRSIMLDLKHPDGLEALRRLIAGADVLIDPYRPGVVEKLGVGPADCLALNPRLVFSRMTGWGQDGPWAHTAGHDLGYIAVTGVLDAIGRHDGPPQVPLNLVGDFGGGTMFLLLGIVSALYERERSGRGQVVDAAIMDGTLSLASFIFGMRADQHWNDARGTNVLDTGAPYYDVYECSDGRYLAVGAIEPQFFAELVRLLELTDVPRQNDRDSWPHLRELIGQRIKERTRDEWAAVFDGTDACVAPVLAWSEAQHHPQVAARKMLVERDGVLQPAVAPRFGEEGLELPAPATVPGSATRAVLEDWGVKGVDDLLASGAAVQA